MEEAGPYVDVIVYPISKGRNDKRERGAARSCTTDLRQKLNDRTASAKFRRLIAANFGPRDWVVTLTYSDAVLPSTPERARDGYLKPCVNKLRQAFRDLGGPPLKYMYVTEGLHGDKRLHHHIILPDTAGIKALVKQCWTNGYVNFERISSRGYETWASYLTKEPRKTGRRRVGDRMWTPSLGLNKPEVITYEVPDDFRFEPPPGVHIARNEDLQTEWFCCQYVSYYKPDYLTEN